MRRPFALVVLHREDWAGNRLTVATYNDDDGRPCSTQLNGHLPEQSVMASLARHRSYVTHKEQTA